MEASNEMNQNEDLMSVNVRGFIFQLERSWIRDLHNSPLYSILITNQRNANASTPVYINRDPFFFSRILDYHVTGQFHITKETCIVALTTELEFWGLDYSVISPCCQTKLCDQLEFNKAENGYTQSEVELCTNPQKQGHGNNNVAVTTTRLRLWNAIGQKSSSMVGMVYNILMHVVNVVFLTATISSTLPSARVPINEVFGHLMRNLSTTTLPLLTYHLNGSRDDSVFSNIITSEPGKPCVITEYICTLILTFDLVFRIVLTSQKMAFIKDPLNFLNSLTLAMMWLSFAVGMVALLVEEVDVRILMAFHLVDIFRFLRVLLLFQAFRYFGPWQMVKHTMADSYRELLLLLSMLSIFAVIYGSAIYLAEVQGRTFRSIPDGIWWAFITMTTVGYGDFAPTTPQGKAVGILCSLTGILCVALPIPIIANNFTKYYTIGRVGHVKSSKSAAKK